MTPALLRHVGPREFHDGHVLEVLQPDPTQVHVKVQGSEGGQYLVRFEQVHAVRAICPENMLLYALAEIRDPDGKVRFVFINWDEDDDATLEIIAAAVRIEDIRAP